MAERSQSATAQAVETQDLEPVQETIPEIPENVGLYDEFVEEILTDLHRAIPRARPQRSRCEKQQNPTGIQRFEIHVEFARSPKASQLHGNLVIGSLVMDIFVQALHHVIKTSDIVVSYFLEFEDRRVCAYGFKFD